MNFDMTILYGDGSKKLLPLTTGVIESYWSERPNPDVQINETVAEIVIKPQPVETITKRSM